MSPYHTPGDHRSSRSTGKGESEIELAVLHGAPVGQGGREGPDGSESAEGDGGEKGVEGYHERQGSVGRSSVGSSSTVPKPLWR